MADTYQWTALPCGVDGTSGKLQLSVLVSPTLDNVDNIATHPFFSDWPTIVKSLRFDVWMNGSAYVRRITPRQDLPDSTVYAQLFGLTKAERPVRVPPGFAVDYPIQKVRDHVCSKHAFAAWKRAGLDAIKSTDIVLLRQSAQASEIQASAARRDNLRRMYRDYPPQRALLESLIARFSRSDGSDFTPAAWNLVEKTIADSPPVEDVSFRLPKKAAPSDILASVAQRDALRAQYAADSNREKSKLLESLISRFSASDGSDLTTDAWHLIVSDIHDRFPGDQSTVPGVQPTKAKTVAYAFHRFHQVDKNSTPRKGGCAPPAPPTYDFHQRITLLFGYPYLLRLAGLVVELEFGSIEDFGASAGKHPLTGTVGVLVNTGEPQRDAPLNNRPPTASPPPGVPTSTLTCYEVFQHQSRKFFLAGDPAGGVIQGIPNLRRLDSGVQATSPRQAPYFLETLDTDGVGRKALSRNAETGDGSETQHALRTAGIMLAKGSRASKANRALQPTLPSVLSATDVMRALRIDMLTDRDREFRWRSLHEREVAYHFFARPSLEPTGVHRPEDQPGCASLAEGMVAFAASKATQTGPATPDPANAEKKRHETLARWDNWGLSTYLPIEPMAGQDSSCPEPPDPRDTLQQSPFPMCATSVPLSEKLPALRIGGQYRLRCRAVDLAGNGLGPDDWPDDDGSPYWIGDPDAENFEPLTHRRWEPVGAPQVLLESQLDLDARPGDSLETIVMRDGDSNPTLERYVAPPRILRWMAEILGCFDGDTVPGSGAFEDIELEPDGSLPTVLPVQHKPQPAAGSASTATVSPQSDPVLHYFYHATSERKPYYPDPYASECTVRLMTNDDAPVELDRVVASFYPFNRTWPNAMPFRLVLESLPGDKTATISHDDAATSDSPNQRLVMDTVIVRVKRGETVQLYIQSNLGSAQGDRRLRRMALWNYLSSRPEWRTPRSATSARDGDLDSLTPTRILKLVHAVKKPVDIGATGACVIQRTQGSIIAGVTLPVRFDVGSTDQRFQIGTSWLDIDDKSTSKPVAVTVNGAIPDFTIATLIPDSSEAGQTTSVTIKTSSKVMVKGQTMASFGSMISVGGAARGCLGPVSVTDARTAVADITISEKALEGPQTPILKPPGQPLTLPNFTILGLGCDATYQGLAIGFNHNLASTKFRRVTYCVTARSKHRDQYPKPSSSEEGNFKSVVTYGEVCALNTDRPPAASIVYTVPSFEWERERTQRRIVCRRRGGCVRIYLERPWFESGEGELVGIVFIPQLDAYLPDSQIGLTSVWGSNPIWRSGPLLDPVGRSHFRDVALFGEGLQVEEDASVKVSVAGYEPRYDAERRLWYCDVKLDPGVAYFPYVRMAVARYQPNSLPGTELSRIVLAPFAQLAPHRQVEVEYGENDRKLHVAVRGVSYVRNSNCAGPARMIARVEERCHDAATNLGWVPAGPELELSQDSVAGIEVVWHSEINLPGSRKKQHYRMVVREEETLPADDLSSANAWKDNPPTSAARAIFFDAIEV